MHLCKNINFLILDTSCYWANVAMKLLLFRTFIVLLLDLLSNIVQLISLLLKNEMIPCKIMNAKNKMITYRNVQCMSEVWNDDAFLLWWDYPLQIMCYAEKRPSDWLLRHNSIHTIYRQSCLCWPRKVQSAL